MYVDRILSLIALLVVFSCVVVLQVQSMPLTVIFAIAQVLALVWLVIY